MIIYIPALDAVVVHDNSGVEVYARENFRTAEFDSHEGEEFLGTFRQVEPRISKRQVIDVHLVVDLGGAGIVIRRSSGIGDFFGQPIDAESKLLWEVCGDNLVMVA